MTTPDPREALLRSALLRLRIVFENRRAITAERPDSAFDRGQSAAYADAVKQVDVELSALPTPPAGEEETKP